MKNRIELSGDAPEAEAAEAWARDRAREARLSGRAASNYGRQVRDAYLAACSVFVSSQPERPKVRISVEAAKLTPRIELVPAETGARRDVAE